MSIFKLFFIFIAISISQHSVFGAEEFYSPEKNTFKLSSRGSILLVQKYPRGTSQAIPLSLSGIISLKDSFINDVNFYNSLVRETFKKSKNRKWNPFLPDNDWDLKISAIYPTEVTLRVSRRSYQPRNLGFFPLLEGEFIGYRSYLWESAPWEYIVREMNEKKRDIIFSACRVQELYSSGMTSEKSYKKALSEGKFFLVKAAYVQAVQKEKKLLNLKSKPYFHRPAPFPPAKGIYSKIKVLLQESSQPSHVDTAIPEGYIPLMCIDADHHSSRHDKDDWRIYTYLNKNNGDFFQYFFFEKELDYYWPLFFRDIALDHLAGVNQCKKSTAGVILSPNEKMILYTHPQCFSSQKILFALTSDKKSWRPPPVPNDKNSIDKKRCFYEMNPGRIFGSYSKVWELDIWFRVGQILKRNPHGIYLVGYGTLLQAEETKTPAEEAAFVKAHGVLITPDLYKHLNALHGVSKKE